MTPQIFASQTKEMSARQLEWTIKSNLITQHEKDSKFLKAVQTSNIDAIDTLLQDYASLLAEDNNGNTCLHIACQRNNILVLKHLFKTKITALSTIHNQPNKNGYTPLHTACAHNHQEMVKFFCNRSWIDWCHTNKAGSNLLHTLCQNNFVELFEIFVATTKKHPIDLLQLSDMIATENRFGLKPFFIACTKNHVEIVASFIKHNKVELNEQQDDESTALHAAVENDSNLVVSVLCNSRLMNINHQNASGSTALHIAVERGNSEIVRTLLEYQANTNIADDNDFIPLDIALSKKNNKIINLLSNKNSPTKT